jgi:hypothetical protein
MLVMQDDVRIPLEMTEDMFGENRMPEVIG